MSPRFDAAFGGDGGVQDLSVGPDVPWVGDGGHTSDAAHSYDTGISFDGSLPGGDAGPLSCGNGRVESGEYCDDGNTNPADGCDAFCYTEWAHNCSGSPSICSPWPTVGTLDVGDVLVVQRGAVDPGGADGFKFSLTNAALLSGSLLASSGDLDFSLEHAASISYSAFSSPGDEVFADISLIAGEYTVIVYAWQYSGPVTSYTLTLVAAPSTLVGWTCPREYFGTGDGCDCGCGILDPDCTSSSATACTFCDSQGTCNPDLTCPGQIDPASNWSCSF